MLGHGLFEISAVRNVAGFGDSVRVHVDVSNVGRRAGTEVAQLYLNDVISSVVTPVKEPRRFRRPRDWQ
jgi:beta-glucosidase